MTRERGWVYFILDPDPPPRGQIKIGKTKALRRRFNTIRTSNPNIRLIGVIEGYTDLESYLHEKFKADRIAGEWFRLTPEIMAAASGGKMPTQRKDDTKDDFMDLFQPPQVYYQPPQPPQYPYHYPQGPTPQLPYPSPGGGWQPIRSGIDPKFLKKYKDAQEKEKQKKVREKKRKKTNLIIDRIFWSGVLAGLLLFISRIY